MKLEELVPPLELCKLIPAGEFEETVFSYLVPTKTTDEYSEIINTCIKEAWTDDIGYECYPAPTLEEIVTEAGKTFDMVIKRRTGANQSLVTNALKQWLKLKGIEE